MNILYIAFSCSPYHGSEDKIGWNVPIECAKKNNVFVITKEEQKRYIEKYLHNKPVENIRFYYVDIPKVYKKVFSGPLYSGRLNFWNRRAFHVAKKICEKEKIDVIHQIAPIEFRSIGDYGKIPGVKFVCGPVGGGEYIPRGLLSYAKGQMITERVRLVANCWYKLRFGITKKLHRCDKILFANKETMEYLQNQLPVADLQNILTEVGVDDAELSYNQRSKADGKCRFLVAGRLVYRKGHAFLLDALERVPEGLDYECRFVGNGPEYQNIQRICRASEKLSKHVVLTGAVPYTQMGEEYACADVFVMPSLRETTGTVLLEAISKGLPVITIGRFGGAVLLDKKSGWLYNGNDKESYIENLKNAIVDCIQHPEETKCRGRNAREVAESYTWEKKVETYSYIYTMLK